MPITSILMLAGIVSAFVLFGAILAWGEHQTRNLPPTNRRCLDRSGTSRASTVANFHMAVRGNPERAAESTPESVS